MDSIRAKKERTTPGPVDRTNDSVELPGVQQDLINALAEENPNVVVVLKSGGICSIPSAIGNARGFLYAFYPEWMGATPSRTSSTGLQSERKIAGDHAGG